MTFTCTCKKDYKHKSNLYRHRKKCVIYIEKKYKGEKVKIINKVAELSDMMYENHHLAKKREDNELNVPNNAHNRKVYDTLIELLKKEYEAEEKEQSKV